MNKSLPAIEGGEKTKKTPFGTGKRFGEEELQNVKEALEQNTLFYWHGNMVKKFNKKFADMYGVKYCAATSSGTAAIHVALGAVGVVEGDEVITSPVTDMGTVIGILFQNAIPVFADLDPHTYNITAESIEAVITEKTKAIIVVHLAGNPADMESIMKVARKHNVAVIEDCAQSYMSYIGDKLAGTFGDIGCFSLNDFKHISAGDGGVCLTNNEELYEDCLKFADKNYSRTGKGVGRTVDFVAPNYRMSELVGAVGLAQLDRVEWICSRRNEIGTKITEAIKDIDGIYPPLIREGNKSSYWFYLFRIDPDKFTIDADKFAQALSAEGLFSARGYIPECIYEYDLFKNKTGYKNIHAPFDSHYYNKTIEYKTGICPVAEDILKTSVKVYINEFNTDEDVDEIIAAIRKIAEWYRK